MLFVARIAHQQCAHSYYTVIYIIQFHSTIFSHIHCLLKSQSYEGEGGVPFYCVYKIMSIANKIINILRKFLNTPIFATPLYLLFL